MDMRPEIPPQEWKCHHEIELKRAQTKIKQLEDRDDYVIKLCTRLEAAIRKHRDERGDSRCWLDDEELYRVLPEGYTPPERDTTVEKANCDRYIDSRHNPKTIYVSPQTRIEELEKEIAELKKQIEDHKCPGIYDY